MLDGDRLHVTDWARDRARAIVLEPPVPLVARGLLETVNFVTIALLPDPIRREYGFAPLPPAMVRKAMVEGGRRVREASGDPVPAGALAADAGLAPRGLSSRRALALRRASRQQLGDRDLNPDYWYQKPACCQLHHPPVGAGWRANRLGPSLAARFALLSDLDANVCSMNTRAKVRELLEEGLSQAEVARRLGLSRATVSHHARRLGLPARESCARRYDWAAVQAYYDLGHSARACQSFFGFCSKTWHDAMRRGAVITRPAAAPVDTYLISGRRTDRGHLKRRLLAAGLKSNVCEECGISEWRGEPLSMALHHVNGNGLDNRLENLRFLCPNCHAQTPNFSGRGVGIPREPTPAGPDPQAAD